MKFTLIALVGAAAAGEYDAAVNVAWKNGKMYKLEREWNHWFVSESYKPYAKQFEAQVAQTVQNAALRVQTHAHQVLRPTADAFKAWVNTAVASPNCNAEDYYNCAVKSGSPLGCRNEIPNCHPEFKYGRSSEFGQNAQRAEAAWSKLGH